MKSSGVLKSCGCWFSDGWVEKIVLHKKKMVQCRTWRKSCNCHWIFRKLIFWKVSFFTLEYLMWLVIVVFSIYLVIFIKKIPGILVQDIFLWNLKIVVMIVLQMLEKICPVQIFKSYQKNLNIKNIRASRHAYEKSARRDVLRFMIPKFFV